MRELGQFAEDYPGALDALFASEDFRVVIKSMLKYRFSLQEQREADKETKIKWTNSAFIEQFIVTNGLGNVIRVWEAEIIGGNKSVSDSIYKAIKNGQGKD